jgi:hypothetical protein
MRGVLNRIAEHDRIINSIAITGPKTAKNPHGHMTWDQAEKIASNARDHGARLVPYRAVPGSYDRARMGEIMDRQGAAETPNLGKLIGTEFEERLKEPPPGERTAPNVVLVPEQIVNQLKEQQAVSSTAGKAGNVAADVFRRTVLPFSTKWLTGNIVEAGVRLGAVGAGPNAYRIGRKLLKEVEKVDAEQAIRVKAALTGGLLFGNKGLTVRRFHEHFEGGALEKPAAAVSVAGQLPVVHQLGRLMKGYTDFVFAFNRHIESASQTAALGKHAKREMQELTGSWAKATRAQEAALRDVANGLMNSKNIHDAARYIDQTLGQYSRFSPPMRRFIQSAAPFLPWYLNAARFVFWTLPAKHPIKTGLYTLVAQNLQDDFEASHGSLPPGDLRGEVVTDDGTVLPLGRFTPFGAFGQVFGGGNEQLTALIDPLFPQFKGAALAAFGLNFAGHQAKVPPEDQGDDRSTTLAVRASMAFNSLLEAFVPIAGIARRTREGGSTGYDNSTSAVAYSQPVIDAFEKALEARNASPKVRKALYEAGIVESGLQNLNYGDRDSLGALQQRPSQGWKNARDPYRGALDFIDQAIPLSHKYASAGELAQAVQRSAFPARYNQVGSQAESILNALTGGGHSSRPARPHSASTAGPAPAASSSAQGMLPADGSGVDFAGLLGALSQDRSPAPSVGIAPPAFAAGPKMPAGALPLPLLASPAPAQQQSGVAGALGLLSTMGGQGGRA